MIYNLNRYIIIHTAIMFYDGKPLSDTDREIVKAFLEGKFGSK